MAKHQTLETYQQISELCARFAKVLGDDPAAIAKAVSAELSARDDQSPEKRKAIEDLLRQSHYDQRPHKMM